MANPDLERIRDRINALREILSGRPPEVTGEVGTLTEEGQRQLDAINKNRLEKSLGFIHCLILQSLSVSGRVNFGFGDYLKDNGLATSYRDPLTNN